jgi:NADPH-dependent 2,4-dienoyl-CoA reductase/sulfur reductase-like enzyme
MKAEYDLIVIGAGPAGLAGAATAAGLGLDVLVLDEQPAPGGQIYRGSEAVAAGRPRLGAILGPDYRRGAELIRAFRACPADYLAGATVWNVSRGGQVHFSTAEGSREVSGCHVLVATGAIERPVPIPGWTLPGVMSAGALQILLKSAGLVPHQPALLAGSGPLLWLLAQQLVTAGAPPAAVVETVPWRRYLTAARELPRALAAPAHLAKGLGMIRAVRAAGVPVYRGASGLRIVGAGAAEALCFAQGGRERRIPATIVALHQGVIPNQQITRLVGATHAWDEAQNCFRPLRDAWLQTDLNGIWVAGDGGGIGGAVAAEHEGRLAALGIAHRLARIGGAERDRLASPSRAALRREQAVRPLLDRLYAPPEEILAPADDVTVCRCEEVTAGAIRKAVAMGCPGPNQVKSFLRCGMGPCQGRLCGPTVTGIIARERGVSPAEIGYYRIRPPLKPLMLGELAALPLTAAPAVEPLAAASPTCRTGAGDGGA